MRLPFGLQRDTSAYSYDRLRPVETRQAKLVKGRYRSLAFTRSASSARTDGVAMCFWGATKPFRWSAMVDLALRAAQRMTNGSGCSRAVLSHTVLVCV